MSNLYLIQCLVLIPVLTPCSLIEIDCKIAVIVTEKFLPYDILSNWISTYDSVNLFISFVQIANIVN